MTDRHLAANGSYFVWSRGWPEVEPSHFDWSGSYLKWSRFVLGPERLALRLEPGAGAQMCRRGIRRRNAL